MSKKGRHWSDVERKAHAKELKARFGRKHRPWTKEEKEAQSEAIKKFYITSKGKVVKKRLAAIGRAQPLQGFAVMSKAKRSKLAKAMWKRPGHAAKVIATRRKTGSYVMSEAQKKKISNTLKGRKQPKRSKEHCKNLSISMQKPETRTLLANLQAARCTKQARPNKKEKQLDTFLQTHYPGEFKLNVKNGVIIGGKVPDFVNVNGKKALVELYGKYWHGKAFTGRNKCLEENRRIAHFGVWGFKTAIIWENELKDEKLVLKKIRKVLR
jgi:hypothetical protein